MRLKPNPSSSSGRRRSEESQSLPSTAGVWEDPAPPRSYGYWILSKGMPEVKPWALVLFSGKSRPGDIQQALAAKGWRVCAIDIVSPSPTNILDDAIWQEVFTDLSSKAFEAAWIATPCETFSPLREQQPGPRVLRNLEYVTGIPREKLSLAEQKQLKESNILVQRSVASIAAQTNAGKAWGMENPDHGDNRPSVWKMPEVDKILKHKADSVIEFDQCRTGLATTKPTIIASKGLDFSELRGLKCNHEKQKFTRPNGSTYWAAHSNVVQQWITNEEGKRERASKSQGMYTTELSEIIARAIHATQKGANWLRKELVLTELP